MALAKFTIYSPTDFQKYLMNTQFTRKINVIQNHHTWSPQYSDVTPSNTEMNNLEGMRRYHIQSNGWSDIGQNITTFPSGNIGLCRPIDLTPAGIFGANTGAICIEHLGNFDAGHDVMTQAHKDTIIYLNALLCLKFELQPVYEHVVYHHWFDRSGKRFPMDKVNNNQVGGEQKTCPGTAFFGTNTIASAQVNFYPLIQNSIAILKGAGPSPSATKKVNATMLNVRSGSGTSFPVIRQIPAGTIVSVYAVQDGWSKISNTTGEWVSSTYLV